jgi:uncharacterized protein (UPF0216 family)
MESTIYKYIVPDICEEIHNQIYCFNSSLIQEINQHLQRSRKDLKEFVTRGEREIFRIEKTARNST